MHLANKALYLPLFLFVKRTKIFKIYEAVYSGREKLYFQFKKHEIRY